MPDNNAVASKDAKTIAKLLWKHKGWLFGIIAFISASTTSANWIYLHFAKEGDLVKNYCIRQAVDLDTKMELKINHHETMISIANHNLDMASLLFVQGDDIIRTWKKQWGDIKDRNSVSLNLLLRRDRNYLPHTIDACIKTPTHLITPKSYGNGFTINNGTGG